MKVHHTIGNHDVCRDFPASGVSPRDPLYGKKLFMQRFGKPYYSFDHKGHHFIVLDSIGVTSDRSLRGPHRCGAEAVAGCDLTALPSGTPVIVSVHIPLVTAFSPTFRFRQSRRRTMVCGRQCQRGAQAVRRPQRTGCAAGPHAYQRAGGVARRSLYHQRGRLRQLVAGTRMGTPEGFTVVTVANGKLTTRYETYGFKSVDPQNT